MVLWSIFTLSVGINVLLYAGRTREGHYHVVCKGARTSQSRGEGNIPSHIVHVGDSVFEIVPGDAVREGVLAFLVLRLAVEGRVVRARVQKVIVNWGCERC